MKNMSRNLLALLLLFGCSGDLTADLARGGNGLPKEWLGAWEEKDSVLNIEPERIVEHDGKTLIVRGFIRREGELLTLRNQGLKETWRVAQSDSTLRITDESGAVRSYQRLRRIPRQVRLEPLHLARSHSLRPERIKEIQEEIERRYQEEQVVLQIAEPALRSERFKPIRERNIEYLQDLLGEVGWIDQRRFGGKTSVQAALMVKHTDDLRLLMTILPKAEEDFRKAGKGLTYAILFDALQLELGRKQRYGTQVQEDETGQPFVLPLEDPDRVDEYLRELGLPSFETYRMQVSRAAFSGKPVQVRPEDGP